MAYYSPASGASLWDIGERWVLQGDKVWDRDMPIWVTAEELWPFREYTWSRGRARREVHEWDELVEEMRGGWSERYPAILIFGRNAVAYLGEGNHRLAIARELGLDVPVRVIFYQNVGSPHFDAAEPRAVIHRPTRERIHKEASAETDALLAEFEAEFPGWRERARERKRRWERSREGQLIDEALGKKPVSADEEAEVDELLDLLGVQ